MSRRRGLSADSGNPLQFLRFCAIAPCAGHRRRGIFCRAQLYGDYLQDVLVCRAEEGGAPRTRGWCASSIEVRPRSRGAVGGQAVRRGNFADRPGDHGGSRDSGGWAIRLRRCLPWAAAIRRHPAYLHDPWELPKTTGPQKHSVLIVGNGIDDGGRPPWPLTQDTKSRAPCWHTIFAATVLVFPAAGRRFRPSAVAQRWGGHFWRVRRTR